MLENEFQTVKKHRTAVLAILILFTTAFACNLRSDQEWTRDLEHVRLSRASNSGSVSSKTIYYFCPGGEYAMVSQFSGFSGGGAGTLSMADEDVERGRWLVRSGNLLLQPESGERREYSLVMGTDNNVVRLDGTGYLAERHNECQ